MKGKAGERERKGEIEGGKGMHSERVGKGVKEREREEKGLRERERERDREYGDQLEERGREKERERDGD